MPRRGFMTTRSLAGFLLLAMIGACCTSCQSLYYSTMETFGKHKRDLLVSRVQDARDEQEGAK